MARVVRASKQHPQADAIIAANAWLKIAKKKRDAGLITAALRAYEKAIKMYEALGWKAQVELVTMEVNALRDHADNTKKRPPKLPKRTVDRVIAQSEPAQPGTQARGIERRLKIMDFIVEYKKANDGNSPTVRQIGDGCDIPSTSVVFFYLYKLAKEGKIMMTKISARGIQVVGGSWTYTPPEPNETG